MQKLAVFNSVSVDGYYRTVQGDMDWAHRHDAEWDAYVSDNARNANGTLLFGRVTYQMMESFWPTEMAREMMPQVAEGMNRVAKVVFSTTLEKVGWNNVRLFRGNLLAEVRKLKQESGPGITIMGSGTLVAPLAAAGLID